MSGSTVIPLRGEISSAWGVVGPFAASATMRALMASALFRVMTFSRAAGTRMSHFMVSNSSLVVREAPGIPTTRIGYAPASIAEGDDFGFFLGKELRDGGSGMTEALNRNGSSAQRD